MNTFTIDIPQSRSWSDDDLFAFCAANQSLRIERDANGFITIMSPSGGLSSYYISIINAELVMWNRKQKQGMVFESSAGFLLPDGSMRAPDIAFISREKWRTLSQKQKEQFPPLCPDFVVELRSPTDRLAMLEAKMEMWIDNGCQLAWLIDPPSESAHIYRPAMAAEIVSGFDQTISGEGILQGFHLDLSTLMEE